MSSLPRRQKVNRSSSSRQTSPARPFQPQAPTTLAPFSRPKRKDCRYCNQDHPLRKCFRFRRLPVHERIRVVRKLGYCFNCLAHSHKIRDCTSRERCGICLDEHHTLLHYEAHNRQVRPHPQRNHRYSPVKRRKRANNRQASSTVSTSSTAAPTIVINVAAKH